MIHWSLRLWQNGKNLRAYEYLTSHYQCSNNLGCLSMNTCGSEWRNSSFVGDIFWNNVTSGNLPLIPHIWHRASALNRLLSTPHPPLAVSVVVFSLHHSPSCFLKLTSESLRQTDAGRPEMCRQRGRKGNECESFCQLGGWRWRLMRPYRGEAKSEESSRWWRLSNVTQSWREMHGSRDNQRSVAPWRSHRRERVVRWSEGCRSPTSSKIRTNPNLCSQSAQTDKSPLRQKCSAAHSHHVPSPYPKSPWWYYYHNRLRTETKQEGAESQSLCQTANQQQSSDMEFIFHHGCLCLPHFKRAYTVLLNISACSEKSETLIDVVFVT